MYYRMPAAPMSGFFDFARDAFSTVAPIVGGVIGGPVGAAAGSVVGGIVGGSADAPLPVNEARTVLSLITPARRTAWVQFVNGIDRTGIWAGAIQGGDAQTLAFEVAGGADRKLTTVGGQQLGARFWQEYDAVRRDPAALPAPATPDYVLPGIDVAVPKAAMSMLPLAILAGIFLFSRSRR